MPEIPLEDFGDINEKLLVEGQVQPQLDPDPFIDLGRGPVADGGQHGIDGDHPADEEGDEQQSQKRQGNRYDQRRKFSAVSPGTVALSGCLGT